MMFAFKFCNGPFTVQLETWHETKIQNGLPSRIKHLNASACHRQAMWIFCNGLGAQSQPHFSMPNLTSQTRCKSPLPNSQPTCCLGNELGFNCGIDCCMNCQCATCQRDFQSNLKHGLPHLLAILTLNQTIIQPFTQTLNRPFKQQQEMNTNAPALR